MRSRKKILVFIEWFPPAFKAGGPVRSVYNLVETLKDEYDISVITGTVDFGEVKPLDVPADQWIEKDGYRVMYLSPGKQKYGEYRRMLKEDQYDFLYLNSLFSFRFSILPLFCARNNSLRTRIVIAPRGMFSPEALIIKPFKKRAFLALSRGMGLFGGVTWHASTENEQNDIRRIFHSAKVVVAMNIPGRGPETRPVRSKEKGFASFIYPARIEYNKNLLYALERLKEIKPGYQVQFDIYGPVNNEEYWKECQQAIHRLSSNVKVNYHGAAEPSELPGFYRASQFLFLPSHSENFGHSIVEAWSYGLPALISDNTPWKDLRENKLGFSISLDDNISFTEAIEFCCEMEQAEYDSWSDNAFFKAAELRLDPMVLRQNYLLFS